MSTDPLASLVVERATEPDADGIEALVRGARINPTALDWHNFVVARLPERGLIGCGQIRKTPFSRTRELKSLVVLSEYRDGRVARALLRALIEGERGPVYGTCVHGLARYYVRLGCEIVPKRDIPLYYRLMAPVAARVHRKRTGREAPEMVVLRYTPPKASEG